jgi:hypothetical protein
MTTKARQECRACQKLYTLVFRKVVAKRDLTVFEYKTAGHAPDEVGDYDLP